ncbi:MAG: hypothetical protein K9J06_08370 [Flavobacteriales bacterium]|nr:hypothetical protein [Flavobacteriales bacterium]
MENDILHRFVRSLDTGELRVCQQYLSNAKGKNSATYKLMFDALLRQKTYNRDALIRAIKGTWNGPRLAREKHRLFEDLIEMVGRLHREREGRQCPWTHWQDARTLLRMGMAQEAADMADMGLKRAMALEDVFAELQLRELLREILKELDRKTVQTTIMTNEQGLQTAVAKVANLTTYTLIRDRMLDYVLKHRVAEAEAVRKEMDEMMRLPEMQGIGQANSLPAQLHYYTILSMHRRLHSDPDGTLEAHRQVVRLWEGNGPRKAHQPHLYRRTLANLIGMLTLTDNHDEAREMLARMEAIPLLYQRDKVMHFCDVEHHYQLFYLNVGELDKALEREEGIMDGLREYGHLIKPGAHISFRYNLAVAHVINDRPGAAKRLFNEIRDMKDATDRQDLQGLARLFHLALFLGDDGFDTFLRNSRTFFRTDDRQYGFEQAIYQWLDHHSKLSEEQALTQSFAGLTEQLLQFEQQRITGAEEFRIWAQAQAEGQPAREVYARRFKR